ncbi:unnamed protein product [Auanema sp. JU1783]|nr:unnamed protein product [Auanema sp. JU1783]
MQQNVGEDEKVKLRNKNTQSVLQRGLDVLHEGELNEETEEIRKLDAQLDHLNEYVSQMEQRLKDHNDKMMEALRQQKEEREKRRKSFHERMSQSHTEDEEFKKQMENILSKVDNNRQRQSIYDFINTSKN